MRTTTVEANQILPENYQYLQDFVYRESGIVLENGKQYLLDARLLVLAREHGLQDLDSLCALLRATQGSPLRRQVVDAMTTNETYFMRETAHYEALRQVLIPELVKIHGDTRRLKFWSAACSTGQEAYTLAMLLAEMGLGAWNIEILGTDLCSKVVERAQKGSFSQIEMNRGLPSTYLLKYFRRNGLEWEIHDEIKRQVKFETGDLRASMRARGPFDVVFCRNVLIYFDAATKVKIIEGIHGTLFRGGHLILGSTETSIPVGDRFKRRSIGDATLYEAC